MDLERLNRCNSFQKKIEYCKYVSMFLNHYFRENNKNIVPDRELIDNAIKILKFMKTGDAYKDEMERVEPEVSIMGEVAHEVINNFAAELKQAFDEVLKTLTEQFERM